MRRRKPMRIVMVLLFIGALIAAVFAFSGLLHNYPVYQEPVTVAPYDFAAFLFWLFLLLFFLTVVVGAMGGTQGKNSRSSPVGQPSVKSPVQPPRQPEAGENAAVSGFIIALFFCAIAAVAGLFGFGAVASTMAGIAMIIFWIAIALGLFAVGLGILDRRQSL